MKTRIACIALLAMVLAVAAVDAGEDPQGLERYYQRAIDEEIEACQKKFDLQSSRSTHLRLQGHREASKALFLAAHKKALVDMMVALELEPKAYKVQQFLTSQFCGSCYATWLADR